MRIWSLVTLAIFFAGMPAVGRAQTAAAPDAAVVDAQALVPDSIVWAPVRPPAVDTVEAPPWDTDLVGRFSASQAAYNNWTEGGLNTLATTVGVNGKFSRMTSDWEQNYEVRLALGAVRQDTFLLRKAEDLIRLTGVLRYRGKAFFRTFNPTLAVNVRTQFITGLNYEKDPLGEGRELPVKVSDFLAPGTFTQSLGLTYEPAGWFRQRLSVGAKETVVLLKPLRPLYGVDPRQAAEYEAGIESTTEINRELVENIFLRSTIGLFAAFGKSGEPDLIWENLLSMKFNKWLSVDFEFTALYNSDISTEVQMKQGLSVGASVLIL